jgi:hypothetical protein
MNQNLFGTPLWSFDLYDNKFCQTISSEVSQYKFNENIFDKPGEGVLYLKQFIRNEVESISEEYDWQPNYMRGRVNIIEPNGNDTPHFHHLAMMVGVYYVSVEDNQGDILLHDPRGAVRWRDNQVVNDTYKKGRTYHRITPHTGMLLLFPNYLVHSVETNLTNKPRISIAIEIYDKNNF